MGTIERFEDVEAWQAARELTKTVYAFTLKGAFAKDWALQGQISRAVVSVMANIAEGFERGGNKEFLQFLATAKGSCGELRSHLCVAKDQQYITDEQFRLASQKAVTISRMIAGLMKYLRQSNLRGSKYQ